MPDQSLTMLSKLQGLREAGAGSEQDVPTRSDAATVKMTEIHVDAVGGLSSMYCSA
jgi:hypothetical protein